MKFTTHLRLVLKLRMDGGLLLRRRGMPRANRAFIVYVIFQLLWSVEYFGGGGYTELTENLVNFHCTVSYTVVEGCCGETQRTTI